MEFSRQEYWSGLPLPSPRDLPNPGIEPWSPALQADSLPSEQPGKSSIFQIRTLLCPPTEACPFSPCLPTSAQVRPAPSFCPSPALSTASGYPRGQRGQSGTLVLPVPLRPEPGQRKGPVQYICFLSLLMHIYWTVPLGSFCGFAE